MQSIKSFSSKNLPGIWTFRFVNYHYIFQKKSKPLLLQRNCDLTMISTRDYFRPVVELI